MLTHDWNQSLSHVSPHLFWCSILNTPGNSPCTQASRLIYQQQLQDMCTQSFSLLFIIWLANRCIYVFNWIEKTIFRWYKDRLISFSHFICLLQLSCINFVFKARNYVWILRSGQSTNWTWISGCSNINTTISEAIACKYCLIHCLLDWVWLLFVACLKSHLVYSIKSSGGSRI